MTNAETDTALAALANVVVPDDRSEMLTAARAIVSTVTEAEGKIADSAKAWGFRLFRQCYPTDGSTAANMDALIGDTKTVADWSSLSGSDAGRKVKGRMEVYFSNARLVAENWNGFTDDARRDMLAGTSSIHYVAGQLRKAAADAKKAADKEAKRVKAEADAKEAADAAAASKSEPVTEAPVIGVGDLLATMTCAFDTMTAEDFAAIADDFNAMVAAYDAKLASLLDAAPAALAA